VSPQKYENALKYVRMLLRNEPGNNQALELEKLIDKMMVEDFSMYTRSDLSRSLREEPHVLEKVSGAPQDDAMMVL